MSATRLHDAGYQDLVSVIPPDGVISANSTVDEAQRGKCPGRRNRSGEWYGYSFLAAGTPTHDDAEIMEGWRANIGLAATRFPAVDIDCDDPMLAAAVRRLAEKKLGATVVRTSRKPRQLLVYRTGEPFPKQILNIQYKGENHKVEVLAHGQQYLIYGRHPSGQDYGWDGRALWEVKPDELPEVTLEDVDDFLTELEEALESRGIETTRSGSRGHDHYPDQADLEAPSVEDVEFLVSKIPNDETYLDRSEYIAMAHAIKAATAGAGEHIFFEWAMRWIDGDNDPDAVQADWEAVNGPFRIGWTWLLDRARDAGYESAREEFEALDPADVPEGEEGIPLRIHVPGIVDFSDEWMTHMILDKVRDELLYIPAASMDRGTWLLWNGYKWVTDDTLGYEMLVRRHLAQVGQMLEHLAKGAPSEKEGAKFLATARRCQSKTGITNVVSLLRGHIAKAEGTFDLDPFHLNTPGGVYNLRTGKVIEGDRMYRLSTPFAPEPGPTPLWDAFLEDLTGGDPEYQSYLQRAMGYALTGAMGEKVFWFIWGSNSDTGKSTFVNTLQGLMGDYTSSIDVKAFMSSDANRLKPELAQLPGVRLVTATEPAAGRTWDEETIKAITGGDTIQTRFLYGQPFTYEPQFKILVIGNHEPSIRGIDDAMKRRVRILPFNIKVPVEKQTKGLDRIMVEREGPQILAWLMEGARLWVKEGIETPDVVVNRTDAYTSEEDMMAEWLGEVCEFGDEYEIPRQTLFENWARWMKARNRDPGSIQAFRQDFGERALPLGALEKKLVMGDGSRPRGYSGVRLRPRNALGTEDFNV